MVKILIGLVAALVLAAAGFFGFEFYLQHRIAGEVDAAFEQVRTSGGKASHGKVSFDLLHHTVTIADIAGESAAQPPVKVKIAGVTASGVNQTDANRFSAASIEATGLEVSAAMVAAPDWQISYKVPQITVKGYSGPAGPVRHPASSSVIDVYRFVLEQFAEITASSVTAPRLAATISFGGATPGNGEVTYSNLTIQDIRAGNIASARLGEFTFAFHIQQAGKAQSITGDVVNIDAHDIDTAAAATVFDPQKANDDQYYTVYRQILTGPYTLASDQGVRMRIDGVSINDIGLRPSRLQLQTLLGMIPPTGTAAPTPAQARDMMEKAARLYEGVRVGTAELRGISINTPQGQMQLAAVRFNLEKGKVGEFAFEGLAAPAPKGPVKLERFALKSIDLANLLRWSALYADPAQKPSPEQALGMLALLQGAEIKGLVAPYKDSGKPIDIDSVNLNWGQFVGPIPSRARLTAKLTAPLDPANPALLPLVAAGLDQATIDFDLGANWTEASHTFVLEPVSLELGNVLKATAQVSLDNVPRGLFSINPLQAAAMAGQIEAGTVAIVLRDLGGVDLAVAQYARMHKLSPDDARRAIIDSIRSAGATDPDAVAIVDAVVHLIERPRGTLTLTLTPRGKVPAMQLVQALKTDPQAALAQFQVAVSTAP